jgi:hypothetical protein
MLSFIKVDLQELSTLQLIAYWLIQVVVGNDQRSKAGSASTITSKPTRPSKGHTTSSTMSDIITPNNIPDPEKLAAMEMVAKMRAAADKAGIPFVGGFIAPDGSKFMMNNLGDDEDAINQMLPDSLKDS